MPKSSKSRAATAATASGITINVQGVGASLNNAAATKVQREIDDFQSAINSEQTKLAGKERMRERLFVTMAGGTSGERSAAAVKLEEVENSIAQSVDRITNYGKAIDRLNRNLRDLTGG